MPKKILEDLEVLEAKVDPVVDEIPEPEEETKSIEKSKKPRSQAQVDAFAKVIEKREANRKMRAELRDKEVIVKKAEIEQKIVEKAISIKKKQIKKQIVLDEISSDDESIEEIKKKIVASKKKIVSKAVKEPEPPKYIFL
jgi:hypothetical protein